MGRGRKMQTLTLKEKPQPSFKANCSAPARNLRKSDLGAVIFGCKNNTVKECYFKDLFGLPAPHFAYVKNITPGLPLFLFNYSDRKLHGIFEATSPGQMSINPYGWTGDGADLTPYPAQVRVCIQRRCCTLTEDQFGPIIADNYYEQKLFWFELDQTQTNKFITLFTSSPYNEDASCSKNTTKWNTFFSLPTSDTMQADNYSQNSVSEVNCAISDQSNTLCSSCDAPALCSETDSFEASVGAEAANGKRKLNVQPSYSSVVSNKGVVVSDTSIFIPQKKWSSLFKT